VFRRGKIIIITRAELPAVLPSGSYSLAPHLAGKSAHTHSAIGVGRRPRSPGELQKGRPSHFYACVRRSAAMRLPSRLAYASARARFWWSAGEKRGGRDEGRKTELGSRV